MLKYVEKLIGEQYRVPRGIVGHIIGKRMARQHEPENTWTVSLLTVQPADHVLEIGFGVGTSIQRLAALATHGHITGIDRSHTMVRAASKRNEQAIKAGRVEVRQGDIAHLPFEDAAFDKILTIHTLYFWSEPAHMMAEVLRVLKPGGTLALTFLPKERWPGGGNGTDKCRVYSTADVLSLMREAGFTKTQVALGDRARFREDCVLATK